MQIRRLSPLAFLILPLALPAADTGTRMLRSPSLSATQITFAYANNIWVVERSGGSARRLFHLGKLTFHPAGASAVRIRFTGKDTLTILDPDLVLTAQRVP